MKGDVIYRKVTDVYKTIEDVCTREEAERLCKNPLITFVMFDGEIIKEGNLHGNNDAICKYLGWR